MTIHSDHPFAPGDDAKDAWRRLRGRLVSPVTIIAAGSGPDRRGLTVSSLVVVAGPEPRLVALVDPDSDLAAVLLPGTHATVSLLEPGDDFLAEAFAGLAPAPGGPFTLGTWVDTETGPRLDARTWCALRVDQTRTVGWSTEVLATITAIGIAGPGGLAHARGRYVTP